MECFSRLSHFMNIPKLYSPTQNWSDSRVWEGENQEVAFVTKVKGVLQFSDTSITTVTTTDWVT